MNNKNKQQCFSSVFFWLLLFWAVFILPEFCQADDAPTPVAGDVVINEIMWMGMGTESSDEWLELKNVTTNNLSLSDCHIVKKDGKDIVKNEDLKDKTIQGNGFFVISYKSKEDSKINVATNKILSYQTLSNTALEVKLICNDTVIDTAGNGDTPPYGENGSIKKSMERDTDNKGWHTCYEASGLDDNSNDCATPGYENSKKTDAPPKEEPENYSGKIIINEISPAPDTSKGEKEFIEIKNISEDDINLKGWSANDSIHTGKPIAEETTVKKGEFYVFNGTFYLNSPGDTAKVFDENGNLVNSVIYDSAKESYSYSFDSSTWRWTSLKTPGEENKFDEKTAMDIKIKRDDEIYKNIYADFEVKYAGATDATKYTWDFGDGHKSYLEKTKHKYEETGAYQASVTIRGDKKDREDFVVEVEDYSAPKVKIIRLVPNPKGKDTEKGKEWIEIENKSKKKINLSGWSIAMGWKNLVNHPIKDDFIIKPGKSKKLTKKNCAFTLNNTQTKIELRDPSGEVAQKLKYNRKNDKIEEDEVFELNGKKWNWNKTQSDTEGKQNDTEGAQNDAEKSQNDTEENERNTENNNSDKNVIKEDIQIDESEIQAGLGKYSENPTIAIKKQNRIQLIGYDTRINTPVILLASSGQVAGAYSEKQTTPEKHWPEEILDNLFLSINSELNWILDKM